MAGRTGRRSTLMSPNTSGTTAFKSRERVYAVTCRSSGKAPRSTHLWLKIAMLLCDTV